MIRDIFAETEDRMVRAGIVSDVMTSYALRLTGKPRSEFFAKLVLYQEVLASELEHVPVDQREARALQRISEIYRS